MERVWHVLATPVSALGGDRRTVRLAIVAFLVLYVGLAALATWVDVPAYFAPTGRGTDAWTYLAAGQRLNAGHALYRLVPSDLPVPLAPPYGIPEPLSPPLLDVLWRPLVGFGGAALLAWWSLGILACAGLVGRLVMRGTMVTMVGVVAIVPSLVMTALSANAYAFLIPALGAAWWLRDRRPALAGALVAAAIAVKLSPVSLVVWLGVTRRWRALGAVVVAGLACVAVSILGAGWSNTLEAITAIRTTSAGGATRISIEHLTGIPSAVIFVIGLAVTALSGRYDRLSFVAAIATASMSPLIAYFGSFAVLAAALAPTTRDGGPSPTGWSLAHRLRRNSSSA